MSFARSAFSLLRTAAAGHSARNGPQVESVRWAGHSHWQNIRHIKAAKDANKAKVTERCVRVIEIAVTMGGGPDPRLNRQLANAIENAKRTQVVNNSAIEAAIKRASEGVTGKNQRQMIYEFNGEHGVLALAKCEAVNVSKLTHALKLICRKHMWAMPKGGVKERFVEKGYVSVTGRSDDGPFDADAALLTAIEAGAEEMNEIGENDSLIHEFLCSPTEYFKLMGALQKDSYSVSDAGTKWIPMMPVQVSEEYMSKVAAFCDELEENPEVVGTYTNIE